ncbi:MAG TPA: proprotein convertase P-domain-containing protein, partial [Saprospiraceae bacterium]|nr:proprotein convertase P-domain-containing protein [Saprospiraceae bacterium]
NPGIPNFTLNLNPSTVSECNDGTVQTTVEVGSFMGFTDPVTLSLINAPAGAVVVFNPTVVTPGNTSQLTISNLTGLFGTYTPTVRGTSTTGNKDVVFTITLLAPPALAPTLTTPANNATNVVITPTLDWQALAGATGYQFQVAYDNAFSFLVANGTVIPDQVQITSALIVNQLYYWRVRAINSCGNGPWSSAFSFTTGSCFTLYSTDVPVIIPATGTPTVYSNLPIIIPMTITDLNIVKLIGTHTWINDLQFSLISPQGTERLFWNQPCANHDDFNINFDDEAQNGNWPCPPTNGLTYKPDNSLTVFDGQATAGNWQMKIHDVADQDGGSLNSWGLNVCGTVNCQLIVNQTSGSGTGTLAAAINCASNGDTITISPQLSNQTIDIGSSPIVLSKNLVFTTLGTNINITGSGIRIFEISAGKTDEFIGLKITAGTSLIGGGFLNQGILKLKNVMVKKNASVSGATLIQNNAAAQLNVTGSCSLNQ